MTVAAGQRPSADLWRLLALTARAPDADHGAAFRLLGLTAPGGLADWRAAHAEAFLGQCAAHASVYLGAEGAIGGEAAARVGDFRRLLGPAPAAIAVDALDGLLADYAELAAMADRAQARHARAALFWEYIACWLAPFTAALARSAPTPYAEWAGVLAQAVRAEAKALGPPPRLPLALRHAPADAEAANHGDGVGDWLLIPVASGVVITRADLARTGEALGVALPHGSRAVLLDILRRQDEPGARAWLTAEAQAQAGACRAETDTLAGVASFWARRAEATAGALGGQQRTACS